MVSMVRLYRADQVQAIELAVMNAPEIGQRKP
jgi:hypothetical protein